MDTDQLSELPPEAREEMRKMEDRKNEKKDKNEMINVELLKTRIINDVDRYEKKDYRELMQEAIKDTLQSGQFDEKQKAIIEARLTKAYQLADYYRHTGDWDN